MRLRPLLPFLCCLPFLAVQGSARNQCPIEKVKAERLPDLNLPRGGHALFCAGGELTVVGGHTTGFVVTPTAEYYSDGQWHMVSTVYTHDDGLALPLSSGQVLIAGGHEKNLGIGQSFEAEMYDPVAHTFTGFGCLDQKRALAAGAELDSGRVVISGNWYADDAIELFDGRQHFDSIKQVAAQRCEPFIFRIAKDDALIFTSIDNRGGHNDSIVVDRLQGEPFCPPLLQQWRPCSFYNSYNSHDAFIGDEQQGIYASLLCVSQPSSSPNHLGQVAIALVRDTCFTLVHTDSPIPVLSPITGDSIFYYPYIVADRSVRRAYLTGADRHLRFYAMCLDYSPLFGESGGPDLTAEGANCLLTLYYTDPLPGCGFNATPVLTPDGHLAIVGGVVQPDLTHNNFSPSASAWLIPVGPGGTASPASLPWPWLLVAVGLVAMAVAVLWFMRRRRPVTVDDTIDVVADDEPAPARHADGALMARICELMDQQKMFRDAELKVSDVASALGTNTRYITDCIKQNRNQTFSQFVNTQRISHAQQLLHQHPDMKLTEVSFESGFANERSFFRTFKAITGMTAREWAQNS